MKNSDIINLPGVNKYSEVSTMADKEIAFEKVEEVGTVKIANEVIMTIASQAIIDIKGVAVATSFAEDIVDKIVKKNTQRGIRIFSNEETGAIDVEIHVNVAYGTNILEISWAVQEAVRKNITAMTDVNVGKINVCVDGVVVEKEPKPAKVKPEKIKEEKED